jgi:hypothetical protein
MKPKNVNTPKTLELVYEVHFEKNSQGFDVENGSKLQAISSKEQRFWLAA